MGAKSSKEKRIMATFAFFISEQDVKKNTPIDENVDSKLLQTAMRTAQDIYIRDILGKCNWMSPKKKNKKSQISK